MKSYGVSIWPTDGCNLKCVPCFFHNAPIWARNPKMMTEEVADAVVKFVNSGITESVSFFGGEPTYNWPIVEYILPRLDEHLIRGVTNKWYGSAFHMTTNGTQLTLERLQFLSWYRVHINLSFEGTKASQDEWRGGSYDVMEKKFEILTNYPSLTVLKLMSDPTTVYEDVKHIRDIGFTSVFVNQLNPFSEYTYKGYSIEDYKLLYKKMIEDLHDPGSFDILDYTKIGEMLLIDRSKHTIGCGYVNRSLGIAPDGGLYPCHQGPSMPEEFKIGDVWNGIDTKLEAKVRGVKNSPSCTRCKYKSTQCYVQMWHKHKRFGVDPSPWGSTWELARYEAIQEIDNMPYDRNEYECQKDHFDDLVEVLVDMYSPIPMEGI